MKKLLIMLLFAFVTIGANAQNIKFDNEPYDYYCVYYGQEHVSGTIKPKKLIWGDRKDEVKLTNSAGEVIEFNNMVDVSNYFSKRGWKVLDIKTFHSYWAIIFVKSIRNDYEAKEGLYFNKDFK